MDQLSAEMQVWDTMARYEEIVAMRDSLKAEYDAARYEPYIGIAEQVEVLQAQIDALEASIRPQIEDVRNAYEARLVNAENRLCAAETALRTAVLGYGRSVKGDRCQAVYAIGRTSWDANKLDGYAAAHPEILPFRKVGKPTVSIRG